MRTTTERLNGIRCYSDGTAHTFVSVTAAMSIVKTLLNEPEDHYGPPALARIHRLEGTGAHQAALDFLAHAVGWLPDYVPTPCPDLHGDPRRWANVMCAAQQGFAEFIQQYEVEPLGIEQSSTSHTYGLGGTVDLYCWMKRKSRRVRAIVDLKFVSALMASHQLQVRCYSRLDGFREANAGYLFHANRNTGTWKLAEVDLTTGLADVVMVACAAKLYAWREAKRGSE